MTTHENKPDRNAAKSYWHPDYNQKRIVYLVIVLFILIGGVLWNG